MGTQGLGGAAAVGEWATPAEAPGGARPPWAALSHAALWVSLVGTRLTTGDTFTAGSSEEAFKIFKQSTDQMCIFKRWLCMEWRLGWQEGAVRPAQERGGQGPGRLACGQRVSEGASRQEIQGGSWGDPHKVCALGSEGSSLA